jgi:hypothetical protein
MTDQMVQKNIDRLRDGSHDSLQDVRFAIASNDGLRKAIAMALLSSGECREVRLRWIQQCSLCGLCARP